MTETDEILYCDDHCTHIDSLKHFPERYIKEETAVSVAELFNALGDCTRVKILYYLLQEELCVYDLTELVGVSQSAVSHQLSFLRKLKIVHGRKDGKQVFYHICNEHIRKVLSEAIDYLSET